MTDTLTIPRTLANRLLTLAQQTPEAEICGLISSSAGNKYHIYPIENVAEDARCVFEMQPQQQISAFREMREKQETLFAIFHSHPFTEAIPSAKDLSDAAYTDALNIIISLGTEGVLDMRGYFYRGQDTQAVELVID